MASSCCAAVPAARCTCSSAAGDQATLAVTSSSFTFMAQSDGTARRGMHQSEASDKTRDKDDLSLVAENNGGEDESVFSQAQTFFDKLCFRIAR